jgi:aerobic-type carbon monoxide dehydrogenase small subunit (CoxS/CutS family)
MRITRDVSRGDPVTLRIDGAAVEAYPGEMLATVMLLRTPMFRRDTAGRPRGMFCNMGSCGECLVTLLPEARRVRACLTPVTDGMEVESLG